MKTLIRLCALLFLQSCQAQKAPNLPYHTDNNSLLWEISGKDIKHPSYLFGTFHLMCKTDIKFGPSIEEAIKASGKVYFEMDMDDPANTLGAIFFMNMKDNKRLKDLFTEEEYSKLENYFRDSLQMSLQMFQKMKPAFMEALLYPKMIPCKNLSSIEGELGAIAKKHKKEILGFETIAMQASVFDSIPYSVQAKGLLKTIDSIADYKKYFSTMVNVYKTENLEEIEKLLTHSDFGLAENNAVLLDNRNVNWVNQLKEILPRQNIFMAVGAGHLVGKMGVIELLRKEGYTVRPLKNN